MHCHAASSIVLPVADTRLRSAVATVVVVALERYCCTWRAFAMAGGAFVGIAANNR